MRVGGALELQRARGAPESAGGRPAELGAGPRRGDAAARRRGCRLDGKLMFTAESTPRFQGERCPASRAGRVPGFRGVHGGAESRAGGRQPTCGASGAGASGAAGA